MHENSMDYVVSDIYLAAYLKFQGKNYETAMHGSRVVFKFEHDEVQDAIQDFYRSEIGRYVEVYKQTKIEMYQTKERLG